jgi:hypothetical protein
VGSNNGQEHADAAYLRERVRSLESEVSRLQETVERLTERSTNGIGQAVATATTRRAKRKAPEAPTGETMGPPPPPPPHSRPASRRLCCSDRTGSDETAVGKGPIGLGSLKALFLRKLEEWWREIAYKNG